MKDQILLNLDNPGQLERLYRADKPTFKRAFKTLYPELQENALAGFWHERLNFANEEISWGSRKDLVFIIIASLFAGLIAKIPAIFGVNEEFFYSRNIGFVVFPALMVFFARRNKMQAGNIAVLAGSMAAGLVYINLLPDVKTSDTLILSCIHLVLFQWSVLGFSFVGDRSDVGEKRLGFLKYNGDLVVMTALILISGGILTAITVNLFALIGFRIEEFYFQNIGVFGLAAAPIVGTYLTQTNPQLVGKVSPVIAKIFSPLVLVMLVVYLIATVYSGKDPYNDREFLLIFNALLIGVMAIIFFSVAETTRISRSKAEVWVLFALSVVTIMVNGIALSAILFRISEWGITPNRAAVLGSNALILINLLLVTAQIYKVMIGKTDIKEVGKTIGYFLPIYFIWTIIVTFVFPLVFGFK
ncbi:hypothetical protein [Dyadobacter alkalitolerans]|uniref:hypothetical protein n=1 Tax=Dyadobacter alkalitolerans TaxID=492736 RepID=UPI00041956E5|nr:hypothetical protein [Dyadobacter alkalitolerans]